MFKRLNLGILDWLTRIPETKDHGLSDFERVRQEIQPCDVLLVAGTSKADRVIQAVSQCAWSHAAMFIGRPIDIVDNDLRTIISHFFTGPPETPLLIESRLGEGIVVTPLDQYEHDHLRLCRPKSLHDKDKAQVILFAINRLGSYRGEGYLLDLVRFFFAWSLWPAPWRVRAFRRWAGRHTKNSTAAFIADCFGFIHFPIYPLVKISDAQGVKLLRRHPVLCLPYEIDQSPNFEIIKYPFIDFKPHEDQRLIPWKGSGVYSGVEQDPALVFKSSQAPGVPTEDGSERDRDKVTPIARPQDP